MGKRISQAAALILVVGIMVIAVVCVMVIVVMMWPSGFVMVVMVMRHDTMAQHHQVGNAEENDGRVLFKHRGRR